MPENDSSSTDAPQTQHVNLATGSDEPTAVLLTTIAELKDVDVTDLTPLYACINSLITGLFDTPPPGEADAVLTFSYEESRITVYQDGLAVIRPLQHSGESVSDTFTPP